MVLRSATPPQSTPTLLHISAIVCSLMSMAVDATVRIFFGPTVGLHVAIFVTNFKRKLEKNTRSFLCPNIEKGIYIIRPYDIL